MIVACCPWCGAEYSASDSRCWDCRLALVDPPPPTLPEGSGDDVAFELDEWSAGERGRVAASLTERGIPFRWEPGLTLVVPEDADEEVDALLDDLEEDVLDDDLAEGGHAPGEADPGAEGLGGEAAQEAMGELFVAADRLVRSPDDGRAKRDLLDASEVVAESAPPFGISSESWSQIQDLADALVEVVTGRPPDDESVIYPARVLRDALRPFV